MQELSTTAETARTDELTVLEPVVYEAEHGPDIFEKRDSVDSDEDGTGHGEQSLENLLDQHELPIELASMTDRYLNDFS